MVAPSQGQTSQQYYLGWLEAASLRIIHGTRPPLVQAAIHLASPETWHVGGQIRIPLGTGDPSPRDG